MAKIKSKKTEERELDLMWKEKVKTRDNYHCVICAKPVEGKNCHAHHILPKQIKGLRWDINNGVTLCYRHHKVGQYSAHMNAIWFTYWLKTNRKDLFKHATEKLIKLGEIL